VEIISGTQFDTKDRAVDLIDRGDHNHWQFIEQRIVFDRRQRAIAIKAGHQNIEQHQIIGLGVSLEQFKGFFAIVGDRSGVAKIL
jgi:hypothetical protein